MEIAKFCRNWALVIALLVCGFIFARDLYWEYRIESAVERLFARKPQDITQSPTVQKALEQVQAKNRAEAEAEAEAFKNRRNK